MKRINTKEEKKLSITANHWKTFITGFRLGRLFGLRFKIIITKPSMKGKDE